MVEDYSVRKQGEEAKRAVPFIQRHIRTRAKRLMRELVEAPPELPCLLDIRAKIAALYDLAGSASIDIEAADMMLRRDDD